SPPFTILRRMKTDMKHFVFSLAFLSSIFAYGAESLPIVKVFSQVCGNRQNENRGSGLLLKYNGSYYVVTSEHVIAEPESKSGCNEILTLSGKREKATLVVADWSKGLALLRVRVTGSDQNAFEWNPADRPLGVRVGDPVKLVGFRYDSFSPNVD